MKMLRVLADDPAIDATVAALVERGVIEPLARADERLWSDCDLAILAEQRLGDRTDPRVLEAPRRTDWFVRAASHGLSAPSARTHERCFWLRAGDERVGTIAIGRSTLGGTLVRLSSLYVFRDARRRGHARRVLTAIRDELGKYSLGLRLDTCWAWQRTLAFYLRLGMWVRMWKHELTLWWSSELPSTAIAIDGDEATLSIVRDGRSVVLYRARRAEDVLQLEVLEDGEDDARSTFAVALAMHGWPLVRSAEAWESARWSDFGQPEALAHRVSIWEAGDRDHGWLVDTPRIPGLEYPSWAQLEVRWAAPE
ncbi:MAG TPA: GNAT family N-acetyltransferase [Nannocystaceae bacterium]|nr:GNAT family N-acetyltransferase [Nannocystaceae bacterium]